MRLEAGLRPDWLGELERSRRPPSRNRGRGPSSKGKGKGKGRDEEVEGKRKEVRKGRREFVSFLFNFRLWAWHAMRANNMLYTNSKRKF